MPIRMSVVTFRYGVPNRILSGRTAIVLGLSVPVTAFLSLGSHDLAIAHLGIPYPADGDVPGWARLVGQVVRLLALVSACRLASWFLDRFSAVKAAAMFGLLVVMLQETFRVIVVDNVVSDGFQHLRWLYLLMTRLPNALLSFYTGVASVVIARRTEASRPAWRFVLVLAASTLGYFVLLPLLTAAAGSVSRSMNLSQPPEVYRLPYGIYVYKYIYGTFLEPTLASFFMVYLLWPSLRGTKLRRVITFTLLMLLLRGRIVATCLFSFWLPDAWPLAVAAEGQFLVETLILAALTGLTWAAIMPPVEQTPKVGC